MKLKESVYTFLGVEINTFIKEIRQSNKGLQRDKLK